MIVSFSCTKSFDSDFDFDALPLAAGPIAEIRVYAGKDDDFALYDDDGASYDYEKGEGVTVTHLHWNNAARALSVTGGDKAFADRAQGLVKVIGK